MANLGTVRLPYRRVVRQAEYAVIFSMRSRENSGGFQLGLLTAAGQCPRWMWEPLQSAVTEGRVALVAVASISGLPKPPRRWIVELYAKWERKRYLSADSLLQDVDVAARSGEQVLSFGAHEVDQLATQLANCRADVLLVTPEADQAIPDAIGIPVWKFQFGASERQHGDPGLWEVFERSLSTISLVETSLAPGSPRVLETIVGRTDPRSWIRNQLGLADKASDVLRRWIPPQTFRAQRIEPGFTSEARSQNGAGRGSSLAVLGLLARFGKHAGSAALNVGQWQLAVDTAQGFRHLSNPEILTPPVDRFWCDPFLLIRDSVLHVFVEECLYESDRGHIAMLSRSPSGEWSGPSTVLDRPYHLSYPFVFEHEGQLLMLPETTAVGRVQLYRCVRFPDQWELDTVLVDNFAGADATLWFQAERWWMFVDARDELYIFYSDSPRGPWHPHRGNPVKSDSRSSRPAGRIFQSGADVIRPAQDCSVQYGREVVFNKVTRLAVCEFEEVEVGRLRTPWNANTCCHTFNQLDGITVVDRLVQRRRR